MVWKNSYCLLVEYMPTPRGISSVIQSHSFSFWLTPEVPVLCIRCAGTSRYIISSKAKRVVHDATSRMWLWCFAPVHRYPALTALGIFKLLIGFRSKNRIKFDNAWCGPVGHLVWSRLTLNDKCDVTIWCWLNIFLCCAMSFEVYIYNLTGTAF